MKKTITVLATTLALALTACGGANETDMAVEETTTAETTTAETTTEVDAPTDAEAEAWVRSQYGLSPDDPWVNAGGNASSITGVRMDGSNMYITMQIDRSTEKDKAESVVKMLSNSIEMSPPEFADSLSWIIVEDGTGTVVKQESV